MKKRNRKRIPFIAAAVIGAAALLAVILLGGAKLDRRMNSAAIAADTYEARGNSGYIRGTVALDGFHYNYYHNIENYLVIGVDNSVTDDGNHTGMADFLLLMSIDKTADTYSLLELNRDTITEINTIGPDGTGVGTADLQLCTAHWYGGSEAIGCENQVRAVSKLLGRLPINGYYSIRMEDIPKLYHAIGGVTITLEDDMTASHPDMKKGATVTLTDEMAEIYLRARMSTGSGTNEERMRRQHAYLEAFLTQGLEKTKTSPRYFYNVFEDMTDIAVTDLTGKQISRIAKALTQNERTGIWKFEGESTTGQALGDGIDHAEFYPDGASVVSVMTEILTLEKGAEVTQDEIDEEEMKEMEALMPADWEGAA